MPFDHAWLAEPQHTAIHKTYLPEDLEPLLRASGVDQAIFVQTQHDVEENRWVLGLAEQNSFLAGVVGWVDLTSDACEDQLSEFKDHPKFVGIRHITQGESDDDFIVRPDVLAGLKVLQRHGVPFELLFFAKHLKHAPTVAAHVPDLPLVIDHLSKPNIKERQFDQWAVDIQAAAAHPNVFCKLSGMITEADWENWTPEDLRPYVETVLEAFGPQRCMYGSDWPVCELAGSYAQVYSALDDIVGTLSKTDKAQIFGGTAQKFYGLT